jgi:hypothetical protein
MNPGERDRAEPPARHDVVCYHEAGHAVAYWRYGIELDYVRVRPTADGSHQGETKTGSRAEVTGMAELENEMKCDAAGDIAQRRFSPGRRVPTDRELIVGWDVFPAKLKDKPELADEDTGWFFRRARARDEAIRNAGTGAPTGPMAWLWIWREAECLIRDELWPAVEAVAEELRTSEHDLSNADVVALAEDALSGDTR